MHDYFNSEPEYVKAVAPVSNLDDLDKSVYGPGPSTTDQAVSGSMSLQ